MRSVAWTGALVLSGSPLLAECPRYEITAVIEGYTGCLDTVTSPYDLNRIGHVVGFRRCFLAGDVAFMWLGADPVIDVPPPPGGFFLRAQGLSDNGFIAGIGGGADGQGSALFYDGITTVALGTMPGGTYSEGEKVNTKGQVVGRWGSHVAGPVHGFIWQDGVMRSLGDDLGPQRAGHSISTRPVK